MREQDILIRMADSCYLRRLNISTQIMAYILSIQRDTAYGFLEPRLSKGVRILHCGQQGGAQKSESR